MIRFTFFEAMIFFTILLWPITQIVLAVLLAISYIYRKHAFGKYSLIFLILFSIIFALTTIYFFFKIGYKKSTLLTENIEIAKKIADMFPSRLLGVFLGGVKIFKFLKKFIYGFEFA